MSERRADAERRADTERQSATTRGLDQLATPALVESLVAEGRRALDAVAAQTPAIADAVDAIVERIGRGGTLHYVGAGTSGRLGALDAAEWLPTFGVAPGTVRAHIAGGSAALERAVEGAEDDALAGERLAREAVAPGDAVVGISASGGAPFVVAALTTARALGALTIALVNSGASPAAAAAERAIVLATGAEPIAGSTRMNAATAQKLVLNAISTATMVRLGRVYDNLMVDLVATNDKLRRRALGLVTTLVPADETAAAALLESAHGSVKVAVVMGRRGVGANEARTILARGGGSLRAALEES
jgi:N-acetylmuramic acid 6-phosphate etherase